MQSLNKWQVDIIVADVERAKITLLHLADDLIDHICCEVESEMNQGKSFEEAYDVVKQQTGIKVLQEIQENTYYLIDKNYRRMKTTMKITGNVSMATIAIATVMKILHLQGAAVLMLLGFIVLCLVFFPSAIYTNYKELKEKGPIALHISILIGGILTMFGILFKVLHWPVAGELIFIGWSIIIWIFLPILLFVKLKGSTQRNERLIYLFGVLGLMIFELSTLFKLFHFPGAAILMILGAILIISVFLPMYTWREFKQTGSLNGRYVYVVLCSTIFILLNVLIALNVPRDVLRGFVTEEQNSKEIANYLGQKNERFYKDLQKNTDNKHLQQIKTICEESDKLCKYINLIKLDIIKNSEKVDDKTAEILILNTDAISNRTESGIVNKLMLSENGNVYASKLKLGIEKYKKVVLEPISPDSLLYKNVVKILDTSDKRDETENLSWEHYTFRNKMIINSLSILTDIEKKVRMVESQAMEYLQVNVSKL